MVEFIDGVNVRDISGDFDGLAVGKSNSDGNGFTEVQWLGNFEGSDEGNQLGTEVRRTEGLTLCTRLRISDKLNVGYDGGCCEKNKFGIEFGRKKSSKIGKSEDLFVGIIDGRRLGLYEGTDLDDDEGNCKGNELCINVGSKDFFGGIVIF